MCPVVQWKMMCNSKRKSGILLKTSISNFLLVHDSSKTKLMLYIVQNGGLVQETVHQKLEKNKIFKKRLGAAT